jgi:hypothetical protein
MVISYPPLHPDHPSFPILCITGMINFPSPYTMMATSAM